MSTFCPLGIAFAVRPSAVAFSSTQPFSSCTKPFARSTWPHAGSVNGAEIYKTKNGFSYPLLKDRTGHYKIQSGEQIRVCMTSDFFLEEADPCTLTW